MKHIEVRLPTGQDTSPSMIMGGTNPAGSVLGVNSRYFVRDQEPWFPIMGELHYSRTRREYWQESVLKIKAGGVGVIATYVFWIHHEEIEGEYDWSGDRDLRCFLELCLKQQMFVFLRIGPWCHGECRNGGFPDWLLNKPFALRANNQEYLGYVGRHYEEIYRQAQGCLFKDGGPIIGVQLENEYGHCGGLTGEEGLLHMRTLKETARQAGFDLPFYTATGWGGAVVVRGEMVPVMSAYAAAPWTQNTEPLPLNRNYFFSTDREDLNVGSDLSEKRRRLATYDPQHEPYLMAELGAGVQVTYHRRPIVSAADVEALALVKLGSGANLLGYYMYHGGSNPVGKLSTLQESRASGYLNDYPIISYDFQAPIREFGQLSDSYRYLKILHLFLNDFGDKIAVMEAMIPAGSASPEKRATGVRFSIRAKNGSGFLFLNNYQRNQKLEISEGIAFSLHFDGRTIRFPELDLAGRRYCILPFNLEIGGITVASATAQLLCKTSWEEQEYYFFFSYPGIQPVFIFKGEKIGAIDARHAELRKERNRWRVTVTKPGTEALIRIRNVAGKRLNIVTLSRVEAENCWKADVWDRERIFISDADLAFTGETLQLRSNERQRIDFSVFPAPELPILSSPASYSVGQDGIFRRYELRQQFAPLPIQVKQTGLASEEAQEWEIKVPRFELEDLDDLLLCIDFVGDTARLYLGERLLADCFYNGLVWEIGLKRFLGRLPIYPLRLRIFALLENSPVYLETPCVFNQGRALQLNSVQLKPRYRTELRARL